LSAPVYHLARLRDGIKPFRLYWFATLSSTNDHAAKLRRQGTLYAPAVVLTSRQTRGRGRGGNTWFSAGGSITVTFALPIDDRIMPWQLPLIAGLAARHAAAELARDNGVQLKWPNDLLYGGRKLAGLLCERVDKVDLIGLGLNVNLNPSDAPPALADRLTSLSKISGQAFDMAEALIVVAQHLRLLLSRAAEQPFSQILREYDSHHALIGRKVSVHVHDDQPLITGKVEGLDDMGRLLVRGRTELHHVIAGQVRWE
jgi:BirA family biotin operon repressor/biotin-[acetyl-CoA-carboxylase] ligase